MEETSLMFWDDKSVATADEFMSFRPRGKEWNI